MQCKADKGSAEEDALGTGDSIEQGRFSRNLVGANVLLLVLVSDEVDDTGTLVLRADDFFGSKQKKKP